MLQNKKKEKKRRLAGEAIFISIRLMILMCYGSSGAILGGSGHPLTCRRTCVTNSCKSGEHYQVKNNEVFRCRVFLLIYTHRSVSSIKKAIPAPSSYPELLSVLGRCREVEAVLSAYSVLRCVPQIRCLRRENTFYWGICFTQPWAPRLC